MKPYTRNKRKPPKDAHCDVTIGQDPRSRQPLLIRCGEIATVALSGGPLPWETFVCEVHAIELINRNDTESPDGN